jgi:hypothetical protein
LGKRSVGENDAADERQHQTTRGKASPSHISTRRARLRTRYAKSRPPTTLIFHSGYPLTVPVEKQTLAGKMVYNVAGGALAICLEPELTLNLIRAVAGKKPERVVCLDEGFAGNDQLKANAVQIFKAKGVTSFKTV